MAERLGREQATREREVAVQVLQTRLAAFTAPIDKLKQKAAGTLYAYVQAMAAHNEQIGAIRTASIGE